MAANPVGPQPLVLLCGRTAAGENVPVKVDADGLLAGGGNPFDQSLNTSDSPTFAGVTVTTINGLWPILSVASAHTARGNVSNGLTTIYDVTLPAGLLANDGDALECEMKWHAATNGNSKSFFLIFGGTTLNSGTDTPSNLGYQLLGRVQRLSGTTQAAQSIYFATGKATTVVESAPAETLSGSIHLMLKFIASSTDDMVANYLTVKYIRAGTQV